jgi:group II intron reverse transcriptase/maturase
MNCTGNCSTRSLYLLAYGRIYANQGSMTPGATQETVDGMSVGKIERIIDAMRSERYRFKPVRRTWIPKKNGKLRPLGMPTWSDKLVGEVVRLLLEAYYEPTFSDRSHGFRPHRGCHTALREVADTWTGSAWFIEGDIADCFGSLDHEVLLRVLGEKIRDRRFLRLIGSMLRAGYLEDWKWNATFSGAPQGAVASPILSNIYLHRLDQFVETVLIPQYTRGQRRARNPAYLEVANELAKARRRGDRAQARMLRRRMRALPSADPNDPGWRRLRYCRYADDHLLGFTGPKSEAEEINQRLAAFLRDELKLELSADKTLITHGRTGVARFLGYDISIGHNDSKTTRGRRTTNGQVRLRVPRDVVKDKCAPYLHRGKPAKQKPLIRSGDHAIVATFGASGHRGIGASGHRGIGASGHRGIGASPSTTCWPRMSGGYTGCAGSWRPPCSRPWQPSTARPCRRRRHATKPRSRHRTGSEPVSRPASNGPAGSHWSHGSEASRYGGSVRRDSPTVSRSEWTIRTRNC